MSICIWCKKPIDPTKSYCVIGNESIHNDCLPQWRKDDPLEWEGMPEPEVA